MNELTAKRKRLTEAQKPTIYYRNQTAWTSGEKLFFDEDTADVHFVLEPIDGVIERVPAHKCQLAISSDVFKCSIRRKKAEERNEILQKIALKDIEPALFNGKLRQAEWNKEAIIECPRVWDEITQGKYLEKTVTTIFTTSEPVLLGEFTCLPITVFREKKYHELRSNLPIQVEVVKIHKESNEMLANFNSSLQSTTSTIITPPKPILITPGFEYRIQFKAPVEGHCYEISFLEKNVNIDPNISIEFFEDILYGDDKKPVGPITALRFNQIQ